MVQKIHPQGVIWVSRMKVYGFDSNALRWVESYLENQKQYVTVSGKISKTVNINTGVPQGSRLSTLLFICLMADTYGLVDK